MSQLNINVFCSFLFLFINILDVYSVNYLDIRKDFGAKGDGKANDTKAFVLASEMINTKKINIVLNIPFGIYIVGKQENLKNGVFKNGLDIFSLLNCSNIKIIGNNSVIKYVDNLYYGSFEIAANGKIIPSINQPQSGNKLADVGVLFKFTNCNNIVLSNVKANGNSTLAIIGGIYGDAGIQALYSGVFIKNSKNIQIKNVACNYFGLDGFTISNESKFETQNDSLKLINCNSLFNGRQGISIVGGIGIDLINCNFSNTGTGAIKSPPMAGIDIEPEVGMVRKINIIKCKILNNKGNGITADGGDSKFVNIKETTIVGSNLFALWLRAPNYLVENCKIYGGIVHTLTSEKKEEKNVFRNCIFNDSLMSDYSRFLVEQDVSVNTSFENSTFICNSKKLFYVKSNLTTSFTNCVFFINTKKFPANDFLGLLANVVFKNNTINFSDRQEDFKGKYISYFDTNITDIKYNFNITYKVFLKSAKIKFQK